VVGWGGVGGGGGGGGGRDLYTRDQDLNMGVKSFTSNVNIYYSLPVHFMHFFIDEFTR